MHPETNGNGHFSGALLSLAGADHAAQVSLSTITESLGSSTIGSLLLFFALPMVLPIPAPGISVLFGVPLILISGQLLFGRRSLWLPPRLANRTISRSDLENYVRRALPAIQKFETMARPRFAGMTRGLGLRAVGAMCLTLALIIALPIPFGHLVPGIAISAMALGLIERDGLAVFLGHLIGGIAIVVVTFATIGLVGAGQSLF
jgi:hypothetical protein